MLDGGDGRCGVVDVAYVVVDEDAGNGEVVGRGFGGVVGCMDGGSVDVVGFDGSAVGGLIAFCNGVFYGLGEEVGAVGDVSACSFAGESGAAAGGVVGSEDLEGSVSVSLDECGHGGSDGGAGSVSCGG